MHTIRSHLQFSPYREALLSLIFHNQVDFVQQTTGWDFPIAIGSNTDIQIRLPSNHRVNY